MATATKSKAPSVADAFEQARAHLDDLTGRLTSGDTTVTRQQLDDARRDAEYADLALQGARTRERREAEEALRRELEAFSKGLPDRAAEVASELSSARSKALAALQAYADVVAESRLQGNRAYAEYADLRPDDVPLGFDDELPDWYRQANPRGAFPKLDTFPALLAVALQTFDSRRTGSLKKDDADVYRVVRDHSRGAETELKNATHAVTD